MKYDKHLYLKVEVLKHRIDTWERLSQNLLLVSIAVVAMAITAVLKGMPLNYAILFVSAYSFIAVACLMWLALKVQKTVDKNIPELEKELRKRKNL